MDFKLVSGQKVKLFVGERETEAVRIAAGNLERDLKWVLGDLEISRVSSPMEADIVVRTLDAVGEREKAALGGLLEDAEGVIHKETYCLSVKEGKLFLTGSDRRGTIYGIYTFCEKIGVSPWYFWADVPVRTASQILLEEGFRQMDFPSVEYRGIFINDEEELEAWVQNYMGEGTIGVKTYEKVFELLLRLKGNYIWPAMHVNSFNAVRENGALADRMGIVVGTSHCDMLMRSNNREWLPWLAKKGYEGVKYDYSLEGRNRDILREYWRESVEQNKDFEVCYTLGMRGIHDSGFEVRGLSGKTEEELRQAKIELLDEIIGDQEEMLDEVLQKETLKTFIPYKEVLELYDHGLKVPEDLTILWANDNYGHIRRYPSETEKRRKGGNGIYYHNSYWAAPGMSYVFLCSIPLAHTGNELRKAWEEGIRKIWVLNCGAMKPLEQEITFFLRLAWEIGKEGALTEDVDAFAADWIEGTFGGGIGPRTACLLNDFAQITNVRKVENMAQDVFSQTAYGDEAADRIHEYERLFREANLLYEGLEEEKKAAFFQLVLMKIHAAYYTNLAYYYGDRSTLMYDRGNLQAAAEYTREARRWEDARRLLIHYYNHILSGGKWKGILDPEGFPPPRAAMMPVCTPPIAIEGEPGMRVDLWNEEEELVITRDASKWIELGNQGKGEYEFEIQGTDWLTISESRGTIKTEKRILVKGRDFSSDRQGELWVRNLTDGASKRIPVRIRKEGEAFLPREDGGLVVLEASQASCVSEASSASQDLSMSSVSQALSMSSASQGLSVSFASQDLSMSSVSQALSMSSASQGLSVSFASQDLPMSSAPQDDLPADFGDFRLICRLGRYKGDLMEAKGQAERPAKGQAQAKGSAKKSDGKPLRYAFLTESEGEFLLELHRFPSLNSVGRLRVKISVDGCAPMVLESFSNDEWKGNWKKNVFDNVDLICLTLPYLKKGMHELEVSAVDPYFAFSRILIYTRPRKENNLAGFAKKQAIPEKLDILAWCDGFYGRQELGPRPIQYVRPEREENSLSLAGKIVYPAEYAPAIDPGWYWMRGGEPFEERQGRICIDMACALAGSASAWLEGTEEVQWRHCAGESFGRSGLALYLRRKDQRWISEAEAPFLHYRFRCEGGEYTAWMFCKFDRKEEAYFGVGLDDRTFQARELYRGGNLHTYEGEQIYRWVPLLKCQVEPGEHVLHIYSLASGTRYERLFLTKGNAFPPMDGEWREMATV